MNFLMGFCTGSILMTPIFAFMLSIQFPSLFNFPSISECALGIFWFSSILLLNADRGYEFEVNLKGLKLKQQGIPIKEATQEDKG